MAPNPLDRRVTRISEVGRLQSSYLRKGTELQTNSLMKHYLPHTVLGMVVTVGTLAFAQAQVVTTESIHHLDSRNHHHDLPEFSGRPDRDPGGAY